MEKDDDHSIQGRKRYFGPVGPYVNPDFCELCRGTLRLAKRSCYSCAGPRCELNNDRSIMRGMNRGRPRNFDPDLVLENAMQLFWSQGYEATSLQDLLIATGLSKSSLYESFGNKQSLFEAAFTRYFDNRAKHMHARLEQAESPLGFVRECLLSVLEDARRNTPRGCMLVNVANEFSTADPAVQPLIKQATEHLHQVFERAFELAQARGELSDRQSPAALALYMHCAMSGLRIQTKSAIAEKDLLTVIELVMASLR